LGAKESTQDGWWSQDPFPQTASEKEFQERREAQMIRTRVVVALLLMVALIGILIVAFANDAEAQPAQCKESTVVAMGGAFDPDSAVFQGKADVVVRHSGRLGDVEGQIAAFDAAVKGVRADCPGTHVIATGFSQGAQAVHVWLQRNTAVPNKVGVLFSDPKLVNSGLAFWQRDNNFGGTTTVSICRRSDVICNLNSWNFGGYPREHLAYNFDARKYAGQSGIVWE
jgi:hypothetical protein